MHTRKKYSEPYLVNKSNRLFATASAHQGFLMVSPVILATLTVCLLPDLDLASTPSHMSPPNMVSSHNITKQKPQINKKDHEQTKSPANPTKQQRQLYIQATRSTRKYPGRVWGRSRGPGEYIREWKQISISQWVSSILE